MDVISIYAPGNLDIYDSYGLIACELLRHLDASGVYVNAFSRGNRNHENQPEDIARLTRQPVRPSCGGLFLGYPTGYADHTNALGQIGNRIAITMFESSKIPGAWVEPLNEMDAVIVPSRFCFDVFADCGVSKDLLHIVPLGISEAYQPITRNTERPLTFLAFLDRGARKGGHAAVQAFVKAFGDRDDVQLILKSREPKVRIEITNPNIKVVQEDMTEAELAELYGRCDVLINPNKGEGFGLIPREFAATGGIALATDWSGTADDIDAWGYPLPYNLVPADWAGARNLEGQDLGVWAEPDIEGIADILLYSIFPHRERLQREAMANAPYIHKLYNWQSFALSVFDIWNEVKRHGNRNPAHALLA